MQGSLADTADLNATKQIGEMAKKAHELMQHQEEIERRVSQRWGDVSTAGDSWAGHYLPAVQVSDRHCGIVGALGKHAVHAAQEECNCDWTPEGLEFIKALSLRCIVVLCVFVRRIPPSFSRVSPVIEAAHFPRSELGFCAQVDSYGSFPFVLIKVADRSGVNKLLVRGKNLSLEPQLLQARHPPTHCASLLVDRAPVAPSAVIL